MASSIFWEKKDPVGKPGEHVVKGLVKDGVLPFLSHFFPVEMIESEGDVQDHPVNEAPEFLIEKEGLRRCQEEDAEYFFSPPDRESPDLADSELFEKDPDRGSGKKGNAVEIQDPA
jgi:hypothetical protein